MDFCDVVSFLAAIFRSFLSESGDNISLDYEKSISLSS